MKTKSKMTFEPVGLKVTAFEVEEPKRFIDEKYWLTAKIIKTQRFYQ